MMPKNRLAPAEFLEQYGATLTTIDIYRPTGRSPTVIRNATLREGLRQVNADCELISAAGVIVHDPAGDLSRTDEEFVKALRVLVRDEG